MTFPSLVAAWFSVIVMLFVMATIVITARLAYVAYRRNVRHEALCNGHWISRN